MTSKNVNLSTFSYQAFYLHNQNVRKKILISQERKEILTGNKKLFFILFKGLLSCQKLFQALEWPFNGISRITFVEVL